MLIDSCNANGEDRKSVHSNLILLIDKIISYRSKTDTTESKSPTEVEYVAIKCSTKDLHVLFNFMKVMSVDFKTITLIEDQPAWRLCLGELIYVPLEFVKRREKLQSMPTDKNWFDIMTKFYGKSLFSEFLEKY
eukprot:snap_masked-scaffold_23-processed-gene-2.7-mRNA-1 protein AED:1.00 eAED:1.00 QI:0/0/0/0/1/1/2/0/133